MESGWLQPVRYLWRACTRERTPRQIALGIALGMVVGLVPKGNLTATTLAVVMALVKLNLGAALLSALVFSLLSPLADPLFHGLGWRLLSLPSLRSTWEGLHRLPIIPWLSWSNTVVLGSLMTGLALMYPAHRVTLGIVLRATPVVGRWRRRWRPTGSSVDGAEVSGPAEQCRAIRPAVPAAAPALSTGSPSATSVSAASSPPLPGPTEPAVDRTTRPEAA